MLLHRAIYTAKFNAKSHDSMRYVVYDPSAPESDYPGLSHCYFSATEYDLDTYFLGCRIECAVWPDGEIERG